jgi:3-methyl-2-oxobutanoate hydroxymethyltransferase
VLVLHDVLGITSGYSPRFVKAYADLQSTVVDAVRNFRDEVRGGEFPAAEHAFE